METRVFKCDVCQREKQKSNHWFIARVGEAFHVYRWEYFDKDREGSSDTSIPVKHLCGESCLLKLETQWLKKGTIPTDPPMEDSTS